ncbi:unnamed protein product [Boreogadus saida]
MVNLVTQKKALCFWDLIEDPPVQQRAAEPLSLLGDSSSAPALSDGRGWSSELRGQGGTPNLQQTEAYKCRAALLSTRLTMSETEQMRMGIYRAERREHKEALRLKEEQCYEKWAAEVLGP